MKKNPIIFSFIVSGLIVFILGLITLNLYLIIETNSYEGWEGLGLAIILVLTMFLTIIVFAVAAILGLIALIDGLKNKRFRKGLYIMYNVVFGVVMIADLVLLILMIPDIGEVYPYMPLFLAIFVLSLVSFIWNIKYLKGLNQLKEE